MPRPTRRFSQKISFDENTDAVILSKYMPTENVLKSEKIYPEEFENGYEYAIIPCSPESVTVASLGIARIT